MDTESIVAIACVAIAIVMLISLTIFIMLKSWRQISRELAEREHSQRAIPETYENMDCIETEYALSIGTNNDHAQGKPDRGQSADSHVYTELVCKNNDETVNKRILVEEETNHDTSF